MKTIFMIAALLVSWAAHTLGQVTPLPGALPDKPTVLVGGTYHLGDGQVIQEGRLLIVGGKIARLVPQGFVDDPRELDATRINAEGKHIYPGFIALGSQLGLREMEAIRQTNDFAEVGSFKPSLRGQVGFNTDSHVIPTVRANGVLLAEVVARGGTISGQSSVMMLDAWNWEQATLAATALLHVHMPSPWRDATEQNKALDQLRQYFMSAQAYHAARQAKAPQPTDVALEAMGPYVTGEKPVAFTVLTAQAAQQALALSDELKLKPVLVATSPTEDLDARGNTISDLFLMAEELARRKVPVVIVRTHTLPYREDDSYDAAYALPAQLVKAGVTVALTDVGFWQQRNLPFQLGTAVAHGMNAEDAIKAATLVPAQILGVADRVGTLAVGKDATLFISEGDALDMRTNQLTHAWVQGRPVSLNHKHLDLYNKWRARYTQP